MKKILLLSGMLAFTAIANAQISISSTDMAVAGDTLRYGLINQQFDSVALANTGANKAWDFSAYTPYTEAVQSWKTAYNLSNARGLNFPTDNYGTIENYYNTIAGLAIDTFSRIYKLTADSMMSPGFIFASRFGSSDYVKYANQETYLTFPLTYSNTITDTYNFAAATAAQDIYGNGTVKVTVDGWGTVKTPATATPESCLRVKRVRVEYDSFYLNPIGHGFVDTTTEYLWLAKGQHYPVFRVFTHQIQGKETVMEITYKKTITAASAVAGITNASLHVTVYPNPSANGIFYAQMPADVKKYQIEVYDITGKKLFTQVNTNVVDLSKYIAGNYIATIIADGQATSVTLVR